MKWETIETEYVTGDISLRNLAKKHKVSNYSIQTKSRMNGWVEKRDKYRAETYSKAVQITQEKILSDIEKGTALLNEAWLNMCDYCAKKSREHMDPIDMQRIANMYSTLMPDPKEDKNRETNGQGIVLLPIQNIIKEENDNEN